MGARVGLAGNGEKTLKLFAEKPILNSPINIQARSDVKIDIFPR
jgi:hypothetical protein